MPSFQPTLATALVRDGKIVSVIHVGSTHMEFDATNTVPCLLLPAPRPIAEAPLEWMDGRVVWLFLENQNNRDEEYFGWGRGRWVKVKGGGCWLLLDMPYGTPTHIMLPPPSPKEANHA